MFSNVYTLGDVTCFRVSDADGSMDMEQVKSGEISMEDLNSDVSNRKLLVLHIQYLYACRPFASGAQPRSTNVLIHVSSHAVSQDVFLIDVGTHCFIYVGTNASPAEKRNAMTYAHVSFHFVHGLHIKFRSRACVRCRDW